MNDTTEALLGFELAGDDDSEKTRTIDRTNSRAMCAMAFSLQWQSQYARHTDQLIARKLNLWRDILPYELEPDLMDKPVDHIARRNFDAGELIVPYQSDLCFNLSQRAFHRNLRRHNYIEPRAGRFYPRAFIGGSRGIFPEEILPFRIGRVSDDMICCDLNNPLSDKALELQARILDIWETREEHGGSCNDVAEMITANGPGMQARWRDMPTDFWQDIPFLTHGRGTGRRLLRHATHGLACRQNRLCADRQALPAPAAPGGADTRPDGQLGIASAEGTRPG